MKHIFLYGPPGVGKTTIGKKLADDLRLSFIDLDIEIEKSAGELIVQIMESQGELAFRDFGIVDVKEMHPRERKCHCIGRRHVVAGGKSRAGRRQRKNYFVERRLRKR